MTQDLRAYLTEKTHDLIAAPSCCAEAKAAGEAWLAAAGTEKEDAETTKLVKELQEDITSIDGLIAFAGSDYAAKIYGKDGAEKLLAHAKQRKADGEKYCDCPACVAAAAILTKLGKLD